MLLDVCLGAGIDGLEVLERLKETWPQTPVLMISGMERLRPQCVRRSSAALDFIEKPLTAERTLIAVRNAIRHGELELANERMRDEIAGR